MIGRFSGCLEEILVQGGDERTNLFSSNKVVSVGEASASPVGIGRREF